MAVTEFPEELVGFGVLLQYMDPTIEAETFISIAGTENLEFPEVSIEAISATSNPTSQGGGEGFWEKSIPSPLSKQEPVTFEMNFLRPTWTLMGNFMADRRYLTWRLVLADEDQTYNRFVAWISKLGVAVPMKGLVKSTITLNPSGAPVRGYLNV